MVSSTALPLARVIALEMLAALASQVTPAGPPTQMTLSASAWAGAAASTGMTRAPTSSARRRMAANLAGASPLRGKDTSQELAGALLARVGEDLGGRALLEDPSFVQEADRGRDVAGEAHLVGGEDQRGPGLGEVAHDGQDVADQLR